MYNIQLQVKQSKGDPGIGSWNMGFCQTSFFLLRSTGILEVRLIYSLGKVSLHILSKNLHSTTSTLKILFLQLSLEGLLRISVSAIVRCVYNILHHFPGFLHNSTLSFFSISYLLTDIELFAKHKCTHYTLNQNQKK